MGVFKKTQQPTANSQLAILAEGCTLKGELYIGGNILIAGELTGEITCQNNVSIGVTGIVHGVIRTRELVVSGFVEGEVNADTLEILSGGRVQGTIQVDQLIIERGGFFAGASETTSAPSGKSSNTQIEHRQPALLEQ